MSTWFALAFFVWLFLPSPSAWAVTYNHTVCIKLRTGFMDAATGDYGTENPGAWIARGVKFNMYGVTRYAGGAGCASFTATSNAQTGVTIYAEARVGGSDNITVRSFSTSNAQQNWAAVGTDAWLEKWVRVVVPVCSGLNCTTNVTNTNDATDVVSNMLAAVTFGIHQIDGNTFPRISGTHALFVNNSGCDGDSDGSCLEDNPITLEIQPDWDGGRRKYLIGHELGHWLQGIWTNDMTLTDDVAEIYYVSDPPEAACESQFIPGDHALRSLEYEVGAALEGIAHFLSTLAFNNHAETNGMFQYYKDVGTYEFDLVNVEQGPTGGSTNWYANGCGCPGDCTWDEGGLVGLVTPGMVTTELDWLRAFWDFRTNANPAPQPTHWGFFDLLEDTDAIGWGLTNTHDQMESVVSASFATRWDEAMDANGADNTPE